MRESLAKVLEPDPTELRVDHGVDRILASAFFRKRPLQAGSSAHVVLLAERRSPTRREG